MRLILLLLALLVGWTDVASAQMIIRRTAAPAGDLYATATAPAPASDLTDFVFVVDLSLMPAAWWSEAENVAPEYGRVQKADETPLASDWVEYDHAGQTGKLRIRWSGTHASAGATSSVRIFPPRTANGLDSKSSQSVYAVHDGYWPEAGGASHVDGTASTANGGVTVGGATGQLGTATLFDDVDDYVDLNVNAYTAQDFTISFWVNYSTTGFGQLMTKYTGSGNQFQLHQEDVLRFASCDGPCDQAASASYSDGLWHHVAGSIDGTNVSLYVDGALEQATAHGGTLASPTADWTLGAITGGGQYGGFTMQDVTIYDGARSLDWIAHDHDQFNDNAAFWGTWTTGTDGDAVPPVWTASLTYSSYYGGTAVEEFRAILPDGSGGWWISGLTGSSTMPEVSATSGLGGAAPHQQSKATCTQTCANDFDIVAIRLSSALNTVDCATYIGGNGEDRNTYGSAVLSGGDFLFTNFSESTDWPTTAGAYDETHGGLWDITLTSLDATCSSINFSTYFGGSGDETPRGGLQVSAAEDSIWVAGRVGSTGLSTVGAYDETLNGTSDGVLAVFDGTASNLLASTYIGGSGSFDPSFMGPKVGPRLYFGGWTNSTDLATVGVNAQTDHGGDEGYLGWIDHDLSTMQFLTYAGGSGNDIGEVGAKVGNGYYYAPVQVFSTDLGNTTGAAQATHGGAADCALIAYDTSDGSVVRATYFGGAGNEVCYEVEILSNGDVLVIGYTDATGVPVTAGAYDETYSAGNEGFFAIFDSELTEIKYATYIGAGGDDRLRGVYYDSANDALYLTGRAGAGFPITDGTGGTTDAYQDTFQGGVDGFLMRFDLVYN